MKTLFALLIAACFAAATAQAQTVSPACNDHLIVGTYSFTVEGEKLAGPPNTPVGPMKGVAMTTFRPDGTLTQIDTVSVNGAVVADFTHPVANGKYSVNSDCTGTFTINFTDGRPPVTTNFVIALNGLELDTVVVAPPGVLSVRSIGKKRLSWEAETH
ncbi:MAG TPA: hypothetical protein VKW78_10165 [Terriglobales bacterium]|nr:hypothetical protein [Terriglobales bacterium]